MPTVIGSVVYLIRFIVGISIKKHVSSGLTLTEMVIALSIITVIFAAVLPQFRVLFNSWDGRVGDAEAGQNGRVLVGHINNQLSKAKKITAVSEAGETDGFIEFEDEEGVVYRYEVGADGYVRFGEVGNTADLAGPVSRLAFTCYGLEDMETATVDVEAIRFVKVETAVTNGAKARGEIGYSAEVFLQVSGSGSAGLVKTSSFEFDMARGTQPAIAEIGAGNYLVAYQGDGDDGWAMVLAVDEETHEMSVRAGFEFEGGNCYGPAMVKVDGGHYLCVYESRPKKNTSVGKAVILTVDGSSLQIGAEGAFEFDAEQGAMPSIVQIDAGNYLCVYSGEDDDGWATVLRVNSGSWEIEQGELFEFEDDTCVEPALVGIDGEHYLCAYTGRKDDGWCVVLTVDTTGGTVSKGAAFEFDGANGETAALAGIDGEHYLCVYSGDKRDGTARVLTVNPGTWGVSCGVAYEFDGAGGKGAAIARIDETSYLCTYEVGPSNQMNTGGAKILTVDMSVWEVGEREYLEYDPVKSAGPALIQIDVGVWLCVYSGDKDDGWAAVISNGGAFLP